MKKNTFLAKKKVDTLSLPHTCISRVAVFEDFWRICFTFVPLPGEFINLAPNPPVGNCARKCPGKHLELCSLGATCEWLLLTTAENRPRFIAHPKSTPHVALQHSFFFSGSLISCTTNLSTISLLSFFGSALHIPAWRLLRDDFYPSVCRRSHTSCK